MTSVITFQGAAVSPRTDPDEWVTVAPATGADLADVLAMMTRCSRATLFRRFHGFTDGAAYARALFVDRTHDETLAARNPSICKTAALEPSPSEPAHCVVGLGTLSPTTEGGA